MSESSFSVREIRPEDNAKIEQIIRAIFPEFGLPLIGTTVEDIEISQMFESYQSPNEVYFIIEEYGHIIGGAGIKPLKDYETNVCELQKMYLIPTARGKGYGKILFNKCIKVAKAMGYNKCYLESASELKVAVQIYESNSFKRLDKPLGNTGHYACGVWMIKDL